jgi:hypothetical protein
VTARSAAWRPGGRVDLERGLDGVGDELRNLRVEGNAAAEQYTADYPAGVSGHVAPVGGGHH